jgi:hypothetical protein
MNLDAEQGELVGHDPMEEVRAIFAVLSKPDGDEANNNFITLAKLHNACQEFEVPLPFCTPPPTCFTQVCPPAFWFSGLQEFMSLQN